MTRSVVLLALWALGSLQWTVSAVNQGDEANVMREIDSQQRNVARQDDGDGGGGVVTRPGPGTTAGGVSLPGSVFPSPTDSSTNPPTDTSTTDPGTGSGTSSASTPGATPVFIFSSAISDMTSCQSAQLTWVYAGPNTTTTISVTNVGVDQTPDSDASSASNAQSHTRTFTNIIRDGSTSISTQTDGSGSTGSTFLISETLSSSVNPFNDFYTWSLVNVPAGYYMAQANISGSTFNSSRFLVSDGLDTSCVITSTASSSATSGSATPTDTATPIAAASSHVNKGAIAGGVVGGLAIVAAVVAAFLFLGCSKRGRHNGAGGGRSGIMGKWGNLGSFDSTTRPSPGKKAKPYKKGGVGMAGLGLGIADPQDRRSRGGRGGKYHSQADSMGPIMMSSSLPHRSVPDGSEEGEAYSPFEEKYNPRSQTGHGYDESLAGDDMGMITVAYDPSTTSGARSGDTSLAATAGHVSKHTSAASSTYAPQNNFSRPRSYSHKHAAPPSPQMVPRSPSNLSGATEANSRRASSPPPSSAGYVNRSGEFRDPSPAYPSGSSDVFSSSSSPLAQHQQSPFSPPHSPDPGAFPSSSAAFANITPGNTAARRTARKPVPTYNPHDPALQQQQSSSSSDSHQHGGDSYEEMPRPDLMHKSSFGSVKQMHVLIPDMPMPHRE